jgi:hypothetical protein
MYLSPIDEEIAGAGDRLVQNSQLLAHRRHDGFDRLPVRLSGGLRGDVRVEIGPDQVRSIAVLTSETHCSVSAARCGSEVRWTWKAAIEIGGYGLRFKQLDVAVAQRQRR